MVPPAVNAMSAANVLRPRVAGFPRSNTSGLGRPASRTRRARWRRLSGDKAVSNPGFRQRFGGVPIPGIDEPDPGFEVQGAQPGDGRVQEQIDRVVGERRALVVMGANVAFVEPGQTDVLVEGDAED